MQFSDIMISPVPISIFLALGSIGSISSRRGNSKLSIDLLQRRLGIGKSKLMTEEGGFGGVTVGCRYVKGLSRVNERLSLLHKAGEVEHCSW